ncbi:MAG: ribonuclease HII [Candidatus Woykebacteria bacterium]
MKAPAHFKLERNIWSSGFEKIAGVDEVGRGAWAGPLVAAAVVFPKLVDFPEELFDSKMLSPRRRESLSKIIYNHAVSIGLGVVQVSTINKIGIGGATQRAFRLAVRNLSLVPDKILIDAFYIKRMSRENQIPIKGGDHISATIAAASIVAKVYRDSVMRKLGQKYPLYNFGRHKGYGTRLHQEAIRANNFCPIHRKSFNLSFLTT